jgi:FimV-like protein
VGGEQKTCGSFFGKVQQQIDNLRNYMGPQLFLIIATSIIAILLLLLVYIIIPRHRNVPAIRYPQDELASKDQGFNIMEGKEGIASKLNLARAYIGMGHESKAQTMLYEVLSHGTDAEQAEAKTLLETIKQHSVDSQA